MEHRRTFLSLCTNGLLTIVALLGAIPAGGYILGPLRKRPAQQGDFTDLGPLAAIPTGIWTLVTLEVTRRDGWEESKQKHAVWVLRSGDGPDSVKVISPICTHLGCPVNWRRDSSQFVCPCHGGTFDASGRYVSGPPPRSLDPLEFRVSEGRLQVRWEDFKIGVAEQIPVRV